MKDAPDFIHGSVRLPLSQFHRLHGDRLQEDSPVCMFKVNESLFLPWPWKGFRIPI